MVSLGIASIAWLVAAILAVLLNAFVVAIADDAAAVRGIVTFEFVAAGVAAATGLIGLRRRSRAFAQWSVLLAVIWIVASFLGAPAYRFEADQRVFVWLPAVAPLVAGIAGSYAVWRWGP